MGVTLIKRLPTLEDAQEKILKIAKKIKLARQLDRLHCPKDGCSVCRPYEEIVRGEEMIVGVDHMRRDVYVLEKKENNEGSMVL